MYQNYNYYPQAQQQPNYMRQMATAPQVGLRGRPVSSLEEARATSIDFDGSVFFFPDLANKRIYTKQINPDGTASLNLYELKEIPQDSFITNSNTYITRDEFERAIAQLKATMAPVAQAPQPAPQVQKEEIKTF